VIKGIPKSSLKRLGIKDTVILQERKRDGDTTITISGKNLIVSKGRITKNIFNNIGLIRWLDGQIKSTFSKLTKGVYSLKKDTNINVSKGDYVLCIIISGSATGIEIAFNDETYSYDDIGSDTVELIPAVQYVYSDSYIVITATSWGSLDIIIKLI